jgi:hypothetical protein
VFKYAFSGKLSPVMTNFDDQAREPLPKPLPVDQAAPAPAAQAKPRELEGRDGPEPTRFGDWELRGRCIDF